MMFFSNKTFESINLMHKLEEEPFGQYFLDGKCRKWKMKRGQATSLEQKRESPYLAYKKKGKRGSLIFEKSSLSPFLLTKIRG